MAIGGNMGIFHALEFDGINSLDYGIYITGEAVYNAPERDVEIVEVKGRNGDIILDNGNFKNIEVSYPAGCFGASQDEFAEKMRAFRAALMSKKGYKRLTDTYNPSEYRLGAFLSAIKVKAVRDGRAGAFEITFNCKPQRFLMSGEASQTITSGQALSNPTPFDAQPLLEVYGYGDIRFNGYKVHIDNNTVGDIALVESKQYSASSSSEVYASGTWDASLYNEGDHLYIPKSEFLLDITAISQNINSVFVSDWGDGNFEINEVKTPSLTHTQIRVYVFQFNCLAGTSKTRTDTITWTVKMADSSTQSVAVTVTQTYDADANTITASVVSSVPGGVTMVIPSPTWYQMSFRAISTVTTWGNPTYIDCELGEAYKYEGDKLIDLNSFIDLGSDLPKLSEGANAFTLANTISELNIIPRWWTI